MDILGNIAALVIGTLLGLLGGGGSVLTVPVLVYLYGITPVTATGYSLFIVGFSSLIGAFLAFRKKHLAVQTAIKFGAPSIFSVFITRKYILPAIPETIIDTGQFVLSKGIMLMLLFAVLMILASISMIKNKSLETKDEKDIRTRNFVLVIEGLVVGLLTGFVGVGGGFLIIPALVLLLRIPMKTAIGTSLAIIAANSLIGFSVNQGTVNVDWRFLLLFSSLALIGIFIGTYLSSKINGNKLKSGFGWFVLIFGLIIITKEIFEF